MGQNSIDRATVTVRGDAGDVEAQSKRKTKGEVSLRRCHVNIISEGVVHSQSSISIQKGRFLIRSAVGALCCCRRVRRLGTRDWTGNVQPKSNALCSPDFYLLC